MKTTHFINLSGGIDSTYYLWRWLKDHPREMIRVHHCKFNWTRLELENSASENIIKWLGKAGYTNIDYVATKMSRGTVKGKIHDIEMIGAVSGFAARVKDIHTVLLSYCYEETPIIRAHIQKGFSIKSLEAKHRTAIFIKMMELGAKRSFDFSLPYINKTKKDMINELPSELLDMTWFCRKPKDGSPCGNCFNCKRVLPALKERQ